MQCSFILCQRGGYDFDRFMKHNLMVVFDSTDSTKTSSMLQGFHLVE